LDKLGVLDVVDEHLPKPGSALSWPTTTRSTPTGSGLGRLRGCTARKDKGSKELAGRHRAATWGRG